MPGLSNLSLGLGLTPSGASNRAPPDILWAGSHVVDEDVALGTQVGGALSATDPEGDPVTFSLVDDADGRFAIGEDGTSIIVTGVLDYETALSEGGGGEPEWLRPGAAFDLDFENDRYYWGGVEKAEVDLTSILGASALLGAEYHAENIASGVGYSGSIALVSILRTALLGDYTLLAEFDDIFGFEAAEESFATDLVASYNISSITLTDNLGGFVAYPAGGTGSAGPHKMAFTVTASSAFGSVDNVKMDDNGDPDVVTTFDPQMPATPSDIKITAGNLKRFTVWTTEKSEADTQALTS